MRTEPPNTVTVLAPGRLHLGFLDPSGSRGRRFGSVGLVVEGFDTVVSVSAARADDITAAKPVAALQIDRAGAWLEALRRHTDRGEALGLRLLGVPPPHAGFGSGTQLAMAIGRAFAQWHGLSVDGPTLARWLGRGRRSGIGLHGFEHGGLLVDGGPGASGQPPPLLARVAVPSAWRVVVVEDDRAVGLAGDAEKAALAAVTPLPAAEAAAICHEVLMRVLPGAADAEFEPFARGVSQVQRILGNHYASAQEGRPYTSAAVGRLLGWVGEAADAAAVGQSSWGPTGFAVVASQAAAEALVDRATAAGVIDGGLALRIVPARNRGAEIIDTRGAAPLP